MKRLFAMLLVLALLLPAALAEGASAPRLEGPGYDTPEDAVLAYLDGLNRGDVNAMLATFAQETLAEHADPESNMTRMQAYTPVLYKGTPAFSDYARSLMLNVRNAQLIMSLFNQYVELSTQLEGRMQALKDAAAVDAMMATFAQSPINSWQGRVEFMRWINPTVLSGHYTNTRNLMNLALMTEYAGADDIVELVAYVRLNGVDAVQLMQCARYGDRWYNLELSGMIGNLLGLNVYSAGMAYAENMTQAEVTKLLNSLPDMEGTILMAGCAASSLAGSRWRLSFVNDPAISVSESADAAAGGAGGVFGELRFFRCGGARVNLRFSPDLAQTLQVDGGKARVTLAWTEIAGMLSVLDAKATGLSLDTSGIRLSRSGNELIFDFANGLQVRFVPAQ